MIALLVATEVHAVSANDNRPDLPDPAPLAQDSLSAIEAIERSEGPYSPRIGEHLLALGRQLQNNRRYSEALTVIKRGVHLARVNGGLYGAEQIPLLESEIDSYLALGDYRSADERQQYLYRVQERSTGAGPGRTAALLRQADWHQRAYQLGLEAENFPRLLNAWELHRKAFSETLETEGENSPELLPPLQGMLRTQYLISTHEFPPAPQREDEFGFADRSPAQRYRIHVARNFERGMAVLRALEQLETAQPGASADTRARSQIRIGDWLWWHGRRGEALAFYRSASEELQAQDSAQVPGESELGTPQVLPAIAGLENLPDTVATEQANAILHFTVSESGRLVDLDRLDENKDNSAQVHRFMRQLRKLRFRPRFEAGKPVATKNVVWAYDTNRW